MSDYAGEYLLFLLYGVFLGLSAGLGIAAWVRDLVAKWANDAEDEPELAHSLTKLRP